MHQDDWVSGIELGMELEALPTPVLCLDAGAVQRNIERMTALCRQHGKQWRPHIKGHRCPQIMALLRAAGCSGVTCATLREAQYAAAVGIRDILIANQMALNKLPRLARLRHVADVILTLDDEQQLLAAEQAARGEGVRLRAIVEVDIGMHRAGTRPEDAVTLAERIAQARHLELVGIMGYEGHLLDVPDPDEKRTRIRDALDILAHVRDAFQRRGLRCDIVSAGGTGSCEHTVTHPVVTELQAGGLVMMDVYYRHACQVHRFDYALTVRTSIVSRPAPDRAIIDAGRKTHDVSLQPPEFLDAPAGIRVLALNAEHGILALSAPATDLRVGQRLAFVPGYSDFTTMLHRCFVAHDGKRVVGFWPIGPR